jgi:hypothetical protein
MGWERVWRSGEGSGSNLAGLLAPRERNKTLTAPAGAEPVAGRVLRRCSGCSSLVGVALGS